MPKLPFRSTVQADGYSSFLLHATADQWAAYQAEVRRRMDQGAARSTAEREAYAAWCRGDLTQGGGGG